MGHGLDEPAAVGLVLLRGIESGEHPGELVRADPLCKGPIGRPR